MTANDLLTKALKASGEPTRLRILALLHQGDLSVGELVDILGQSQPRLSHHLKTLTQAGLVERLPEGSWVYYRTARHGQASRLLATIFNCLDTASEPFAADRIALTKVRGTRAQSAEAYFSSIADDWDNIRSLHFPTAAIETALLDITNKGPFEKQIDLGTGTGRMLTLFAPRVKDAEGLDISHHMLTVARANLARSGVAHARVRQGDVTATPFEDATADLVTIHQVLHFMDDPSAVIHEACRLLKPGGELVIIDFATHELDFLREKQGHKRLGIRNADMEAWCADAGLTVSPPHRIDPPETLEQGLSVLIWKAIRPSSIKDAVA
jgi:ArsR family transcriptional regulator